MGDRSFQAGKGSADRSPGWRDKYDDIAWPDGGAKRHEGDGFVKRGGKLVKQYGPSEAKKDNVAPAVVIH
jgi:hypothetical protein